MKLLGRRDFVAGLGLGAGAFFLNPLARSLIRQAQGAEARPRFILFQDSQGWDDYRYEPAGADLTSAALNPAMEPLEPFKDRMLILDRFYNFFNVGLHGNGSALLSMAPSQLEDPEGVDSGSRYPRPGGITMDRLIGRHLSEGMPLVSLNLSIQGGPSSADGPGQGVPNHRNPFRAFDDVFGDLGAGDLAGAKRRFEARRRTLDFLKDDVGRLSRQLAAPEKEKLDQYLSSVADLDAKMQRLAMAAGQACQPGDAPAKALDREQKKRAAIDIEVLDALVDIGTTALLCGRTNVLGLSLTPGRGNYVFLGLDEDKHNTQHDSFKEDEGQAARDWLVKIDRWHSEVMARVLNRLDGVKEVDGTALDRTLTMWINGGGGKHHSGRYKDPDKQPNGGVEMHPAVLIGNPTGALRQQGRFLRYDLHAHSLADLHVTVANALGVAVDRIGEPSVNKGPLPGLL